MSSSLLSEPTRLRNGVDNNGARRAVALRPDAFDQFAVVTDEIGAFLDQVKTGNVAAAFLEMLKARCLGAVAETGVWSLRTASPNTRQSPTPRPERRTWYGS